MYFAKRALSICVKYIQLLLTLQVIREFFVNQFYCWHELWDYLAFLCTLQLQLLITFCYLNCFINIHVLADRILCKDMYLMYQVFYNITQITFSNFLFFQTHHIYNAIWYIFNLANIPRMTLRYVIKLNCHMALEGH